MTTEKFQEEMQAMRPHLVKKARSYLRDTDEAEDVVQDTLLKLWSIRSQLDSYHSIQALAITVTRHLSLNKLREKQTASSSEDLAQASMITDKNQPDSTLIKNQEKQLLLDAISRLPDMQQTILRIKRAPRQITQYMKEVIL